MWVNCRLWRNMNCSEALFPSPLPAGCCVILVSSRERKRREIKAKREHRGKQEMGHSCEYNITLRWLLQTHPKPSFQGLGSTWQNIKSICLILIFSPLSVASLNTGCGELLSENIFLFFLFLCCSGLLSSMFSRSRQYWGWKLTTPCLWPRTRLLEKQWWPSTPSLSHRNTWRGVYLCTAWQRVKPFFSTSCKTEVVLVFKARKEGSKH